MTQGHKGLVIVQRPGLTTRLANQSHDSVPLTIQIKIRKYPDKCFLGIIINKSFTVNQEFLILRPISFHEIHPSNENFQLPRVASPLRLQFSLIPERISKCVHFPLKFLYESLDLCTFVLCLPAFFDLLISLCQMGLIILRLKSGPTLGLRRGIPHSPVKSLEFNYQPIRRQYSDSCFVAYKQPLIEPGFLAASMDLFCFYRGR